MTMIGIFAQADIASDNQFGELSSNELSGEDDRGLRIVGWGTSVIFLHVQGNSEENDGF